MKHFNAILSNLIKESGKSLNQISKDSGVDRAYLSRLLSGERQHPSSETVIRLWIGIVGNSELLAKVELCKGLETMLYTSMWTAAGSSLRSDVIDVPSRVIS